jgi:hypothetical protein
VQRMSVDVLSEQQWNIEQRGLENTEGPILCFVTVKEYRTQDS